VRAAVIGASGQVGTALRRRLSAAGWDFVGTRGRFVAQDLQPLDIADLGAVERFVTAAASDCVFFPAALTFVDYCEDHPDEAMRLNRDAPATAARAAAKQGARFVFYSSEYVFDGTRGPYAEDDPPCPMSVYGRSKHEGELATLEENPLALVIRTQVVYGPEPQGKNFVYQLLRRLGARETVRIPVDQVACPTYNVDLAAASVELVERGLTGIYHVAGSDALDRHAFARLACEVFWLDASRLQPVKTADLGQRARRPLLGALRSDRTRAVLTTELRGAREGLVAMKQALAATPV
jgi:dTDP-4-dehydrorhamnose reductase